MARTCAAPPGSRPRALPKISGSCLLADRERVAEHDSDALLGDFLDQMREMPPERIGADAVQPRSLGDRDFASQLKRR